MKKLLLFIIILISVTFHVCGQETDYMDLGEKTSVSGAYGIVLYSGNVGYRMTLSTLQAALFDSLDMFRDTADNYWLLLVEHDDSIGSYSTRLLAIESIAAFDSASTSYTLDTLKFTSGTASIREYGTNNIMFKINSADEWYMTGNYFRQYDANKPGINGITPTGTAPVFLPRHDDANTGIGSAAADQLSLIAGGVEGVRVYGTSKVNVEDTLSFGVGNAHIRESNNSTLTYNVAAADKWIMTGNTFKSITAAAAGIYNGATSNTQPSFRPRHEDTNTGVGSNAVDQVSIIGGGVEGARIESNRVTVDSTINFKPHANPPSSPQEGDVYYDSDVDSLYLYNGSGWAGLNAVVDLGDLQGQVDDLVDTAGVHRDTLTDHNTRIITLEGVEAFTFSNGLNETANVVSLGDTITVEGDTTIIELPGGGAGEWQMLMIRATGNDSAYIYVESYDGDTKEDKVVIGAAQSGGSNNAEIVVSKSGGGIEIVGGDGAVVISDDAFTIQSLTEAQTGKQLYINEGTGLITYGDTSSAIAAHRLVDTLTISGGAGLGITYDTLWAQVDANVLEWFVMQDSAVLDSVITYCEGIDGDISIRSYVLDNLADDSPTYIHAELNPVTATEDGTTIFTVPVIGPGQIVRTDITAVGDYRPDKLRVYLFYHEKRAN